VRSLSVGKKRQTPRKNRNHWAPVVAVGIALAALTFAVFAQTLGSGFVAMDDPFVNLDPDRQKKAAELIRSFAERKQVLLFTCHPRVAELLDADPVRL
jgi:uncharacterized protein YhaN